MGRRKQIKHTLLIVCEGENTEPLYFQSIKDIVQSKPSIWTEGINITISPIPKIENKETNTYSKINHKRKGKQRKLQPPRIVTQGEIEDKYKAEPIRFVREAQIGLEDGAYDEAWAVFDYDNRFHTKAAFDLANTGDKKVNIAYSNYSFEMWLLMHFEKNKTAFEASDCGINDKNSSCKKCIGCHLRNKGYLAGSTKESISLYPKLEDKLNTAYHHAAWLRKQNNLAQSLNKLSAYTDVDYLVNRLFNQNNLINWIDFDNDHPINNNLKIKFKSSKNKMVVIITNESSTAEIIQKDAICLEDENYKQTPYGKHTIIEPQSNKSIEIPLTILNQFKYISFSFENEKVLVQI